MTRLVQVALRATDLDGTRLLLEGNAPSSMLYLEVADVRRTVAALRGRAEIVSEPHLIFTHEDGALGPAGTTEWQAFLNDSEGNLVGLVSFEPSG
jgi:methylmalonyl-CoA/ethylmalonyl-CoA epimerase